MGKEGFGVADNLSTPPSSLPPTPTDGLIEDDGEVERDNHQVTKEEESSSPSPVVKEEPLMTASRVIELLRPKCDQGDQEMKKDGGNKKNGVRQRKESSASNLSNQSSNSSSGIPPPVDPDTPLLKVLSEMEKGRVVAKQEVTRGSNHSLASADIEDVEGNPVVAELDESSINEELSAVECQLQVTTDNAMTAIGLLETSIGGEDIYDAVAPDEEGSLDPEELDRRSFGSNLSMTVPAPSLANFSSETFANYVNIDYFLRREETSSKNDSDDNESRVSRSVSSADDLEERPSLPGMSSCQPTYDEVARDADFYGEFPHHDLM